MSRVLVLEKDPELGTLFRFVLEGQGHEVVSATGLDEAEAILASQGVHLVLIEVPATLPDRRVLTFWRQRLRAACAEVPVLLCSSSTTVNQTSAVVAGYEGYLAMPFELEEAFSEIARLIEAGMPRDCDAGCPGCGRD